MKYYKNFNVIFNMLISFKILKLIIINLPLILQILGLIKNAADRFFDKKDKREWVECEIKIMFPWMNDKDIDNWIEAVLYLARLIGIKI